MRVRRVAALVVVPVIASVALAACGGGDSGSSGGTVSIGIGEPRFIVPTNTNDTAGGQVVDALFTPLVKFDASNKAVEDAAEKISTSDSKVWTVKLKEGWTFHNGDKVTADDYIAAWNYGAYAPNAQQNNTFFASIDGYAALNPADKNATPPTKELSGLKKVSDTEFTITLTEPYADFRSVLGYSAFVPMPKVAFTGMDTYKEAPIGQGPFKMKGTWVHDQKIEVEAYDAYKGEKPKIKGVNFKVYQQPTAQYSELLANTVDVMTSLPTSVLSSAKTDLGDRYKTSPSSSFTFIALPLYNPKFTNVDVRKAISMAIDREEITKVVFKDSRTPAHAFVSPVVPGYRADACGEGCKFEPAKAKELLTKAGGFPGGTLTITYNVDGDHKEWVDAVCNQIIKNLGIQCVGAGEPKFADLRTKAQAKQDIGAFRLGWAMDYPSMENYLTPLYSTTGSSNYYGYANKEFDDTVAAGNREATADGAIKKYQAAEDMLARDIPVAPLFYGQNVFGYSTKVTNVEVNPFTRVDLLKIETK
ncbi:ABC transporter substrate-binding protein [Longispora sp. NPDC051575]|uniref:peptide ABC transporter substrate-binding protein n=1 Tax=Longispora sp. NPDC051575 TaxID=3154943 RepID=UPI003438D747